MQKTLKLEIDFFSIGIHSMRGMELYEKEAQKDYRIQEIYLERTYS